MIACLGSISEKAFQDWRFDCSRKLAERREMIVSTSTNSYFGFYEKATRSIRVLPVINLALQQHQSVVDGIFQQSHCRFDTNLVF